MAILHCAIDNVTRWLVRTINYLEGERDYQQEEAQGLQKEGKSHREG
jgi:hypothetical protein